LHGLGPIPECHLAGRALQCSIPRGRGPLPNAYGNSPSPERRQDVAVIGRALR
jgi:hypothetical protein